MKLIKDKVFGISMPFSFKKLENPGFKVRGSTIASTPESK